METILSSPNILHFLRYAVSSGLRSLAGRVRLTLWLPSSRKKFTGIRERTYTLLGLPVFSYAFKPKDVLYFAFVAFCHLKRVQIWIFLNESVNKEWLLSSNPLCTQWGFYSGFICIAGRDKVWQRFSKSICGAVPVAGYLFLIGAYWILLR